MRLIGIKYTILPLISLRISFRLFSSHILFLYKFSPSHPPIAKSTFILHQYSSLSNRLLILYSPQHPLLKTPNHPHLDPLAISSHSSLTPSQSLSPLQLQLPNVILHHPPHPPSLGCPSSLPSLTIKLLKIHLVLPQASVSRVTLGHGTSHGGNVLA